MSGQCPVDSSPSKPGLSDEVSAFDGFWRTRHTHSRSISVFLPPCRSHPSAWACGSPLGSIPWAGACQPPPSLRMPLSHPPPRSPRPSTRSYLAVIILRPPMPYPVPPIPYPLSPLPYPLSPIPSALSSTPIPLLPAAALASEPSIRKPQTQTCTPYSTLSSASSPLWVYKRPFNNSMI